MIIYLNYCLLYDNRFQRECPSWHPNIKTSTVSLSHQYQVQRFLSCPGRPLPDLKLASRPEMSTSDRIDQMIHAEVQGSEGKQNQPSTNLDKRVTSHSRSRLHVPPKTSAVERIERSPAHGTPYEDNNCFPQIYRI